jgi:Spy/CpxP family protein refolding chaperone
MLRSCILVLALLGGLTAPAAAQPGGPRGVADSTRIEERITILTDRLSLSEKQTAELRTILYDEAAQARQAMQTGDRDAMRQSFRERMKEADRRIEEILTEEQKEAYHQYREERRKEMQQRFEGREYPRQ